MRLAGLMLLLVSTVISWDFVLNYGIRGHWQVHPYGKLLLLFMSSISAVLTLTTINGIFLDYPGRAALRLIFFGGFVAAILAQDLFLRCQLGKAERANAEHDKVDNAVQ